jgi:hypothetical protein
MRSNQSRRPEHINTRNKRRCTHTVYINSYAIRSSFFDTFVVTAVCNHHFFPFLQDNDAISLSCAEKSIVKYLRLHPFPLRHEFVFDELQFTLRTIDPMFRITNCRMLTGLVKAWKHSSPHHLRELTIISFQQDWCLYLLTRFLPQVQTPLSTLVVDGGRITISTTLMSTWLFCRLSKLVLKHVAIDGSIPNHCLPETLEALYIISSNYDAPLTPFTFPQSLRVLHLSNIRQIQTLDTLPSNLIELVLSDKFNQPLPVLPRTLQTLVLGNDTWGSDFDQCFVKDQLPPTLTTFRLYGQVTRNFYTQSKAWLPRSLTSLILPPYDDAETMTLVRELPCLTFLSIGM